jgi:hypothetical protein
MTFPLSLTGSILFPQTGQAPDTTAVAVSVEVAIRAQRPRLVSRLGTAVDFRVGVFRFVPSPWTLFPINRGRVDVRTDASALRILYTVRFTEVFAVCAIASVFFASWVDVNDVSAPLTVRIIIGLLTLGWLFGINVAMGMYRFRRLLRRAAGPVYAG